MTHTKKQALEKINPEVEEFVTYTVVEYPEGAIYRMTEPIFAQKAYGYSVYYSETDDIPKGFKREVPYVIKHSLFLCESNRQKWLRAWRKDGSPLSRVEVTELGMIADRAR
jgi:hypothetical protein